MIAFLATVRIGYFSDQAALVLRHASLWSLRAGIDVDVNSAADGRHSATTLHTWDLAWDLDTAGDKPEDLRALHAYLMRWLPRDYDVLLQQDHVHVEWDMHR